MSCAAVFNRDIGGRHWCGLAVIATSASRPCSSSSHTCLPQTRLFRSQPSCHMRRPGPFSFNSATYCRLFCSKPESPVIPSTQCIFYPCWNLGRWLYVRCMWSSLVCRLTCCSTAGRTCSDATGSAGLVARPNQQPTTCACCQFLYSNYTLGRANGMLQKVITKNMTGNNRWCSLPGVLCNVAQVVGRGVQYGQHWAMNTEYSGKQAGEGWGNTCPIPL